MKAEKESDHRLSNLDKNILRMKHGFDKKGELVCITHLSQIFTDLCEISHLIQKLTK